MPALKAFIASHAPSAFSSLSSKSSGTSHGQPSLRSADNATVIGSNDGLTMEKTPSKEIKVTTEVGE